MQRIEKGLAAGDGFSGGSVYTGLAGIAHAYLHLYETVATTSAGQEECHAQTLQMLAASQESLLSRAVEMAELARAHQEVQGLYSCSLG